MIFKGLRRKREFAKVQKSWRAPDELRSPVADEFDGETDALIAEIERLSAENLADRDREIEYRLLRLRHLAAIRLIDEAEGTSPEFIEPDATDLPEAEGLPPITPDQMTPQLVRAGIQRYGSVHVRGLVDRDEALRFAEEIDRAFEERDRYDETEEDAGNGYYREFMPDPRFLAPMSRPWIKAGGGVLATDAPMLLFDMLDVFNRTGLTSLARDYLGEPVAISAQKTTLRKADPSVPGAWHQDGRFMGPVRALNVWVALSRCGDEAPGLDIVPRRLEDFVKAGGAGTMLDYEVTDKTAKDAARDTPIVRPIFEPGDVMIFDELCLHQTASEPTMPNPRYAIESWFFGVSSYPPEFAPVAA